MTQAVPTQVAGGKEAEFVALVDASGTVYTASGGGGGGGAVTEADGANVALGTTTDAKVTGDSAGTVAAKLRGLNTVAGTPSDTAASVTILGRLINFLSRFPAALGSATSANSLPVVIASDQAAVAVDSELPAAAALSDAATNPTAPAVGGYHMGWDATQWKRVQQSAGHLTVYVGGGNFVGADGLSNSALVGGGFDNAFATGRPVVQAPLVFNGATWDRVRTPTVFKTVAAVAVTAATPQVVWTPTTGKKFRLMGYALSLSVAGAVILLDNTSEVIRTPAMAAGAGSSSPPMGNGILSAAINQALKVDVTASGTVHGFVFGTEE